MAASEGADRARWRIASWQMALFANANRDPKKGRAYGPSDFDPYELGKRKQMRASVSEVKHLFIREGAKQ